jgi:hypothetical protein
METKLRLALTKSAHLTESRQPSRTKPSSQRLIVVPSPHILSHRREIIDSALADRSSLKASNTGSSDPIANSGSLD